jgi:hypothetical protein
MSCYIQMNTTCTRMTILYTMFDYFNIGYHHLNKNKAVFLNYGLLTISYATFA